jgi:PAS domain S-box-containing protein
MWRFTLWSLLGILAVLVLLTTVYHRLERDHLEGQFGDVSVALANLLRNSLVEDGLIEATGMLRSESGGDPWQRVDTLVRRHINGLTVVKVKIYDRNGRIHYSSNREEVGSVSSDNPGVVAGLRGEAVASIVDRDEFNTFDGVVENRNLHQQYIPLRSPESDEILGVFEVYSDATSLIQRIESTSRFQFFVLAGVLTWFFLGQFLLYYRTDKALIGEQRQTKAYLRELEQSQAELEARVRERTQELEASRHFLQSVIDGIASPVMVIEPDLSVSMLNAAAKRQSPQYRNAEDRPKCFEISHRRDTPCEEPDHPCGFREVLKTGAMVTLRHNHTDDRGEPVVVDVISTPLRDEAGGLLGVIEVHHDVTELVQTQSGLMQSEARLQAIMDNVPDAILTYDESGCIDSANRVAERLFDRNHDRIVGASIADVVCSECVTALEADAADSGQPRTLEAWAVRDGARFPAELWIGRLNLDGQQRYIAVTRDISERKRAEKELEQTRRQYYHQEKMAAIGQLSAGILHEVGNPIAAIAGAAEELQEGATKRCGTEPACLMTGAMPDNLRLILEQTDRLAKITRDIAEFASPRPMERELLDLNGLIRSTARLVSYDKRFRGIRLELTLDHNLPAIYGVADQLTQVLMNLLINATDAVSDSPAPRIDVSTRVVGSEIELTVRDNGTGMDRETLARAMEPFFTSKPVGKGTGLGLSLCETIVSAHGGKLSIDSEEGKGTSLTLRLPGPISDGSGTGEPG